MQTIKFTKALLNDQWHDQVTIVIDDRGLISDIRINDQGAIGKDVIVIDGFALPGMTNIHSHAFQRAMAGLTEYATFATSGTDSFWTWRDVMYRFAQKLTPEDLYDIARELYLEMVMSGYTSVAEFHYLHHQPGGRAYDNPAEMSLVLAKAAEDVGINLTLLPVLYMSSGFGGLPLNDAQTRFGHSPETYCALLDQLHDKFKDHSNQKLGVAFHSLRAVPPDALDPVIRHMTGLDPASPLHIHIAEQIKEVADSLAWSGKRPVEWLLENQDLDRRWCLIHATHLSDSETIALAKSNAVVGLCPTTEANLGDGLFPLKTYLDHGGTIAIGSDSHISVSPVAELRLLEYGQRLQSQSRNIVTSKATPHSGMALYLAALKGGAQASGFKTGQIKIGMRADLITLDPQSPILVGTPDKFLLDRFIFSGNISPIQDVMVAGVWKVRHKAHSKSRTITDKFRDSMIRLTKILD